MNKLVSWLRGLRQGAPVVVVSGLPRSGTSMVMQMLAAGGQPVAADGRRAEDEDNPRGYFELEQVKDLDGGGDRSWVREHRGRAVKVVSSLLRRLPADCRYRVVFVSRDLDEVLLSQRKMLRRRGEPSDGTADEKMKGHFEGHLAEVTGFLRRSPLFDTLFLEHRDLLDDPEEAAHRINAFLGGHLDEKAMASAVDGSLYRSRAGGAAGGVALLFVLGLAVPAEAYIGPGAGFAFVSTFFIFFLAFLLALGTILLWPLRRLVRPLLRRKKPRGARTKRVVVLGLDGMDPELTEKYMAEGLLPNFVRLRDKGAFTPLRTTVPAESPVAWSTFMTGCNPGKHGIYDFLVPDRRSLLPVLSSSRVTPSRRSLKIGRYRIPLGRPRISSGRRSTPFWKILGDYGIFSTIVRVPLTFPPEKFHGVLLSAMCVPDLKGSQGTFFYYTSDLEEKKALTSGIQLPLKLSGKVARGTLSGPENSLVEGAGEMELPFRIILPRNEESVAELRIGRERHSLKTGEYTPWVRIAFRPGLGMKVHGLCRFLLLETAPHVRLYVTPLQIDPERPALPISHPASYAVYLAKLQGPFATLGVAEDTSALNEGVIDGEAFLAQCSFIHREREKMFFDALDKTPRGAVVGVFDLTDRVQHMFLPRLDEDEEPSHGDDDRCRHAVRDAYVEADRLLGRVMETLDDDSVLVVMSDHGFKPFRRGVDLNAWLKREGYLAEREGAAGEDMLRAVDWEKTRAYAVGFGGIYLNVAGREARGTVSAGEEAETLKAELTGRLLRLSDEREGVTAVKEVFDGTKVYRGPYVAEAPDLIAGFRPGYRAAWRTVTGGVGAEVFEDNERPWGGDHNMNPADVPGIFFCSRAVSRQGPGIEDVAPTVLDLLGVPVPGHMDGKVIELGPRA